MAICAGCRGGVKNVKALHKNVDGKELVFCCEGCEKLYRIENGKLGNLEVVAWR